MDRLFAPWRIEWVERENGNDFEGCPFCVLPDRDADRDSRIVARSDRSFVLLNNYPYNPGHAMVIPNVHEGDYAALSPATITDHARTKQATFEAMRAAFAPDGVNVGMNHGGRAAGGSVGDHVHTHVVPRWEGDTSFMPVVADTKVIVEAVDETFDRLRDAFRDLPAAGEPADEDSAVPLQFD